MKRNGRKRREEEHLYQGCRISAHHAMMDKFYEKAARALEDPELDRVVARAIIPILEAMIKRLRAEVGE